ncbi:hypothetical protein CGCF413_v004242 [Colletotrichum fructicola]|nr:hypothetical protein CGCF413_v004242 [Colletotrichum fructicola]
MPQLKLPGPMGFPWATPPPIPPKEPRKGDPSDPDDPKPSETPTTTSSESSCTASTTLYPNCGQSCVATPVTTIDKSTSFSTSCFTVTCQPTVVCSKTVETTTTTTISTASATPTEFFCSPDSECGDCELSSNETQSGLSKRVINYVTWNPPDDDELLNHADGIWVKRDDRPDARGNEIPIKDRGFVTTWPAVGEGTRFYFLRQHGSCHEQIICHQNPGTKLHSTIIKPSILNQEIRGNVHKKDDVHMADITISETKDGKKTVLESEQHSDGGKFRSLPSAQTLTDDEGNELRIEFKKEEHHNMTLWANSNGKPEFWSIENLEKDEKNPMKPWCDVTSTVPNVSYIDLSISY